MLLQRSTVHILLVVLLFRTTSFESKTFVFFVGAAYVTYFITGTRLSRFASNRLNIRSVSLTGFVNLFFWLFCLAISSTASVQQQGFMAGMFNNDLIWAFYYKLCLVPIGLLPGLQAHALLLLPFAFLPSLFFYTGLHYGKIRL